MVTKFKLKIDPVGDKGDIPTPSKNEARIKKIINIFSEGFKVFYNSIAFVFILLAGLLLAFQHHDVTTAIKTTMIVTVPMVLFDYFYRRQINYRGVLAFCLVFNFGYILGLNFFNLLNIMIISL